MNLKQASIEGQKFNSSIRRRDWDSELFLQCESQRDLVLKFTLRYPNDQNPRITYPLTLDDIFAEDWETYDKEYFYINE